MKNQVSEFLLDSVWEFCSQCALKTDLITKLLMGWTFFHSIFFSNQQLFQTKFFWTKWK